MISSRHIMTWRGVGLAAAIFVFVFLILPTAIVIIMSFGDKRDLVFPPTGFSLDLFRRFFAEPGWTQSALLSFRIAILSATLSLVMGTAAAIGLARSRFRGKGLVSLFLHSPIMIPGVAIALALYLYLNMLGIRNNDARLILGHVVMTLPFVLVTVSAGLRHIDETLETVATVMGAGLFTVFRRVTVPLLAPALTIGWLFAFVTSFDEVIVSWFLVRAGHMTLPVKMYSSIMFDISPVLAAVSTMLTGLTVFACIVMAAMQKKEA
ncbi:ABC transporter permease [Acuticoccus mangrovi]|uniref:ABC transporter permease n=1 Tax=Acuticoccus mangrovi TaxID=2796142 RepID=A0A934ITX9_9HYPH|nr:ABC transporter permease [Acuticoccus mangrovi]MBJ3777975.1 ABC transporter permease [Acuticoccus mangrovi]